MSEPKNEETLEGRCYRLMGVGFIETMNELAYVLEKNQAVPDENIAEFTKKTLDMLEPQEPLPEEMGVLTEGLTLQMINQAALAIEGVGVLILMRKSRDFLIKQGKCVCAECVTNAVMNGLRERIAKTMWKGGFSE